MKILRDQKHQPMHPGTILREDVLPDDIHLALSGGRCQSTISCQGWVA
jgi:hypothetical protein